MLLFSCNVYRRDILLKASKEKELEFAQNALSIATPPNYRVAKNDFIEFALNTNKGEAIIDPTSELIRQVSSAAGSGGSGRGKYLVQADGCADLPIIGHTKVDSLTIHQLDSFLAKKYGEFYQEVFVTSKVTNRRIYILGMGSGGSLGAAIGVGGMGMSMGAGNGRIFELERENITLFEVIASNGGVGRYSYTNRVKVLRGDLKNPTIFTVDLTKWDSFQKANLIMQPNDIIYIEPLRRGVLEFIGDFTGLSAIATSIISIYLITRL
jgi:polysaccharide export outer membrane protein